MIVFFTVLKPRSLVITGATPEQVSSDSFVVQESPMLTFSNQSKRFPIGRILIVGYDPKNKQLLVTEDKASGRGKNNKHTTEYLYQGYDLDTAVKTANTHWQKLKEAGGQPTAADNSEWYWNLWKMEHTPYSDRSVTSICETPFIETEVEQALAQNKSAYDNSKVETV